MCYTFYMEETFTDVETDETLLKRKRQRYALIALLLLLLIGAVLVFGRCNPTDAPAGETAPAAAAKNVPAETVDTTAGLFIAFLDVGQGDCIFLRAPDGKTMLVDSGPAGSFGRIKRFLDKQGVTRLDMVVATHMHEDHIGSMREVVEQYEIGAFYLSPFDIESSAYARLVEALDERGVAAVPVYASATSVLAWSDAADTEVRVLAPYAVQYEDENDTSVMLHVRYGQTAALLTGDATALSERLAVKAQHNRYLRANVLKVGHHGGASSTSKKFLSAVKPEIAVISVGKSNDYDHPSAAVLERLSGEGARVLRTDERGTIRILLDGTRALVIE